MKAKVLGHLCVAMIVHLSLQSIQNKDLFEEEDIVWDVGQYYSSRNTRSANKTTSSKVGNCTSSSNTTCLYPVWRYRNVDSDGSVFHSVPYTTNFTDEPVNVYIRLAMRDWNRQTCVKFVRRSTETNYVNFVRSSKCSSYIGMKGGRQDITLGPGCLYVKGSIMHELGHVLGLFHEHSRKDRDGYVEILEGNLLEGTKHNFEKRGHVPAYVTHDNYDYLSIMHYGKTQSSKPPYNLTTIRTLDPAYQDSIGQRSVLSKYDVEKINMLYSCDCKIVNTTTTITVKVKGVCSFLWWSWECIKEKEKTETYSKKICSDVTMNKTPTDAFTSNDT